MGQLVVFLLLFMLCYGIDGHYHVLTEIDSLMLTIIVTGVLYHREPIIMTIDCIVNTKSWCVH